MLARWWEKIQDADGRLTGAICRLCFHRCRIGVGGRGFCGARFCTEEGLISPFLGQFSSVAVDPVEKKPLFHWRPGSQIFSLGSLGCTMRCPFCQNHQIAQPVSDMPLRPLSPQTLLSTLEKLGLTSVAFTYNEPTLQAEYILEAGPLLKSAGAATALVTNGMLAEESRQELLPWIDAVNVDLKSFNRKKYAAMGGSLETVKATITDLFQAGCHLELTTLVVPGISDSRDEMAEMSAWIASLSPEIPLHLSRYFPNHTYTAPATSLDLLRDLAAIAGKALSHVHLGNVR